MFNRIEPEILKHRHSGAARKRRGQPRNDKVILLKISAKQVVEQQWLAG
jgi:hypothetical protein